MLRTMHPDVEDNAPGGHADLTVFFQKSTTIILQGGSWKQETVTLLKDFRILFDIYHHNPDNHIFAFEAVIVIVQYAMDHGHPLFDA